MESNNDDSDARLIKSALFLGILVFSMPVSSAIFYAEDIEVNDVYVACTGQCTCGVSGGAVGYAMFYNYCPLCGGKLYYSYDEGENGGYWACYRCDADYCLLDGKVNSYDYDAWLIPYHPKPKAIDGGNKAKIENTNRKPHNALEKILLLCGFALR